MTEITRKIEFDAGHRVLGHESKCANLHGHRYVAEITVTAKKLDDLSRVIDFSVVKSVVGGWVDVHWDHTMILSFRDPLWEVPADALSPGDLFGPKKPYLMPIGMNTTAECLADVLFHVSQDLLSTYDIEVVRVRIYETPNCWADYEKPTEA